MALQTGLLCLDLVAKFTPYALLHPLHIFYACVRGGYKAARPRPYLVLTLLDCIGASPFVVLGTTVRIGEAGARTVSCNGLVPPLGCVVLNCIGIG